jgi:hypothetical protein
VTGLPNTEYQLRLTALSRELFFPYLCLLVAIEKLTNELADHFAYRLLFKKLGLTGFDRMRGGVSKHAGSWGESLER